MCHRSLPNIVNIAEDSVKLVDINTYLEDQPAPSKKPHQTPQTARPASQPPPPPQPTKQTPPVPEPTTQEEDILKKFGVTFGYAGDEPAVESFTNPSFSPDTKVRLTR